MALQERFLRLMAERHMERLARENSDAGRTPRTSPPTPSIQARKLREVALGFPARSVCGTVTRSKALSTRLHLGHERRTVGFGHRRSVLIHQAFHTAERCGRCLRGRGDRPPTSPG
jgi:hypothetical protein